MSNKFKDVLVEPETEILLSKETKFDQYDVLFEIWSWDGIHGQSLVFLTEDIQELSEEEIRSCQALPLIENDSGITVTQSDSPFTFVNFNFEVDQD